MITRMSALEIFTNPEDLEFTVGQEGEGENATCAFGIFRGPRHKFKSILTSQPFKGTTEDAIGVVKKILESICKKIREDFADDKSILSQYLNPEGGEIDEAKVLNPDLITRILDELRQNKTASTDKMFVQAG